MSAIVLRNVDTGASPEHDAVAVTVAGREISRVRTENHRSWVESLEEADHIRCACSNTADGVPARRIPRLDGLYFSIQAMVRRRDLPKSFRFLWADRGMIEPPRSEDPFDHVSSEVKATCALEHGPKQYIPFVRVIVQLARGG